MTLKQKVLDFLRTHPEPFTLKILMQASGGRETTIRGYISALMAEGYVAFAEPRTHETRTAAKPWGNWKERKYKKT